MITGFQSFKELYGFRYLHVSDGFDFTIGNREEMDVFRNEIYQKKGWCGVDIWPDFDDESKIPDPLFDSGVVCAKNEAFVVENGELKSLNGFVAPYRLMSATIGARTKDEQWKRKGLEEGGRHPDNEIAVAIGMVLSIVALKGSKTLGDERPYFVFTKRANVGLETSIREGELDTAVVEGMNLSDVYQEDGRYKINLEKVANRAIEEERGLNLKWLKANRMIQMPSRYYLGYDAEYRQWNFFGTVKVNCTIEEVVREGCYFTKDKFESKGILGMPLNMITPFVFLSFNKLTIDGRDEKKEVISIGKMWNTGWASLLFSFIDCKKKISVPVFKDLCFYLKNHPKSRDCFKDITIHSENGEGFNKLIKRIICFFIGILGELFGSICNLPLLGVLVSSLVSAVEIPEEYLSRNKVIALSTYSDLNEAINQSCEATRVFRGVKLIDGNMYEGGKLIHVSWRKAEHSLGRIRVFRRCRVFNEDRTRENELWRLKKDDAQIHEEMEWQIIGCENSENRLRIVVPCIDGNEILLDGNGREGYGHCIDFDIEYKWLVSQATLKGDVFDAEEMIKKLIREKITNYSKNIENSFDFWFLLQEEDGDRRETIVCCPIVQKASPLNKFTLQDSENQIAFVDNISRVVYEYTRVKQFGYSISR